MATISQNTYEGHLEVIAILRDRAIEASMQELERHDALTVALREMLSYGADINDLSAVSGLTPEAITRRTANDLVTREDLEALAGLR